MSNDLSPFGHALEKGMVIVLYLGIGLGAVFAIMGICYAIAGNWEWVNRSVVALILTGAFVFAVALAGHLLFD